MAARVFPQVTGGHGRFFLALRDLGVSVGRGGDEHGTPCAESACGHEEWTVRLIVRCVEVAVTEQAIHVRDSKDVTRPAFAVGREGWGQFVRFASES